MGRPPLPLGSWGRIWVSVARTGRNGKPTAYRARAWFRDFNGVSAEVVAEGRTRTLAEQALMVRLRERTSARHGGTLKSTDRFSEAANLWFSRIEEMVADRRRSAGTAETYRRQLDGHVLPALAEVRIGEITPPLLDRVLHTIKNDVSAATARSCRSVISGILGLAVRHGALPSNPTRDIERLAVGAKRRPRALDDEERDLWFAMLSTDPKAKAADLPDLSAFMLATGARIGETLGLTWRDVDLDAGQVAITQQVTRLKGVGLVRAKTKSRAGERVLRLPAWAVEMLERRAREGVRLDDPVFSDALGHFRDPSNVRRDLRRARSPVGGRSRQELGSSLALARRAARVSRRAIAVTLGWPSTRLELIEQGRVRVSEEDVALLLDAYGVPPRAWREVLVLAKDAAESDDADALSWITSHTFRRTTATVLDEAGQSARQIADQLGHARLSLTQDVYMGRGVKNPGAAAALDRAFGTRPKE